MRGYGGQLTHGLLDLLIKGGTLQEVFEQSAVQFPTLFNTQTARYVGVKEVFLRRVHSRFPETMYAGNPYYAENL